MGLYIEGFNIIDTKKKKKIIRVLTKTYKRKGKMKAINKNNNKISQEGKVEIKDAVTITATLKKMRRAENEKSNDSNHSVWDDSKSCS
ncbi:hypothetical protein AGMMS49921_13820 [Endomicrobiia bacterium]|nr:hypothetical protein AGMMS49921_13820 [Endomicrobiia bacterium]